MPIPGPDPAWTTLVEADVQLNSVAISDDGRFVVTATSLYGTTRPFATYVYDATSPAEPSWVQPIDATPQKDGAFWVAMSGDGKICATGGTLDEAGGFFVVYETGVGPVVPLQRTPARVMELELSADGADMVAVSADQVAFAHGAAVTRTTLARTNLVSCAISRDGQWIAVGSDTPTGGAVHVFQNVAGTLQAHAAWPTPSGVVKVAMEEGGGWLAAGCRDGSVILYERDLGAFWTYEGPGLGRTYGLSMIIPPATEQLVIAAAANVAEPGPNEAYGQVYVLDSLPEQHGPVPSLRWSRTLEFAPNPGIHIDPTGTYVTALDGQPLLRTGSETGHLQRDSETPGNFYLFSATDGRQIWRRQTGLMNWGMAINRSATAIAGGSDSGVLYYWGSPTDD